MIVPQTSNLRRAEAAGNVMLPPAETGLDRASVALVCQVMAIDKAVFHDISGSLSTRARKAIDAGLRLALAFGPARA